MSQSTSGFRHWFLEQLAMYLAYHRNRRNQATHHVGVPLIVFSLMIALTRVPIFAVGDFTVTAAAVVLIVLGLLYIAAVPLVGVLTVIFYGVVYGVALKIAGVAPVAAWSVVGSAFIGGWIIQFVGHAFEGRRPAFTANLLQIFMAPPFLIAEILFAGGLEAGLQRALQERAVKY